MALQPSAVSDNEVNTREQEVRGLGESERHRLRLLEPQSAVGCTSLRFSLGSSLGSRIGSGLKPNLMSSLTSKARARDAHSLNVDLLELIQMDVTPRCNHCDSYGIKISIMEVSAMKVSAMAVFVEISIATSIEISMLEKTAMAMHRNLGDSPNRALNSHCRAPAELPHDNISHLCAAVDAPILVSRPDALEENLLEGDRTVLVAERNRVPMRHARA